MRYYLCFALLATVLVNQAMAHTPNALPRISVSHSRVHLAPEPCLRFTLPAINEFATIPAL